MIPNYLITNGLDISFDTYYKIILIMIWLFKYF